MVSEKPRPVFGLNPVAVDLMGSAFDPAPKVVLMGAGFEEGVPLALFNAGHTSEETALPRNGF